MNGEGIVPIVDSLAVVQEHFNTNKDKFRFIALVSPT